MANGLSIADGRRGWLSALFRGVGCVFKWKIIPEGVAGDVSLFRGRQPCGDVGVY